MDLAFRLCCCCYSCAKYNKQCFFSLPEKVNLGLQQGVDNLTDPTKNCDKNFQILSQKLWDVCFLNQTKSEIIWFKYCMCAIITRSWIGTALNYKPQIFCPKIEEFPNSVHKLSVTLTVLQYKPQWKIG